MADPENLDTEEATTKVGASSKASGKQAAVKKKAAKKVAKKSTKKAEKTMPPKRPYPRLPLEQAIRIPLALKEKNGGNAWPPSDLATAIGLSPKTNDFFYLAAASRDFGILKRLP